MEIDGQDRLRRPSRVGVCICLLVALVATACGGRATKNGGTAATKAPASEQPGAQQEPAGQAGAAGVSSAAPAAEPGAGASAAAPAASADQKPAAPTAAQAATTKQQPAAPPSRSAAGGGTVASKEPAGGGPASKSKESAGVPTPPVPAPPSGGGHAGPANLSPVNIGTICECSGPPGASIGAGIASNQLVVKWINENGGLNGHPIRLFVADSNSDPNRYYALLKRMVEEDKVIAFLGHMSPLTVNVGDKYLREKGIPVVGGDGAHSFWFKSPVLFFPGPSYFNLVVATAKLAVTLKTPKIAMLYCAEAEPCQVGRDALHSKLKDDKAPEAQIVYEAKISLAQPDFSAECLQAQSKGAQSLILFMDAAAASRATRSCIQQGYRPQWLQAPLTSAHADDPNLDGVANPVATFPSFLEETPAQRLFHDAIRRYNPSLAVNATTSVVWVSGQMLLAATRNLPAENPTPQDIMNGIWSIKNNPFDGLVPDAVSFPQGQPSPDHLCYFVVQIKNGAYTAPYGSRPQCM